MTKESGGKISRRLFVNRSVALAGGAAIITSAGHWPLWAGEPVEEGVFERMVRMARDPETGEIFVSLLKVDLAVEEVSTKWGPTRVTSALDRVLVKKRETFGYSDAFDVSQGGSEAKLDPRIDARGGRAAVVWCGCDPATRDWHVYLAYRNAAGEWAPPRKIAGGPGRPALHPDVALDPATGEAWVAYEDWSDGSVRLLKVSGERTEGPFTLSEAGGNYRPRVIVTGLRGPHRGAAAVAWDSYRDGAYNIHFRTAAGGMLADEIQATGGGRWDSCADLAEDRDGNIWLAWARASNELSQTNALRTVHVKYFDGKEWFCPLAPETLIDGRDFKYARAAGLPVPDDIEGSVEPVDPDRWDGRISGYNVCWFPKLLVDSANRVHVAWREGYLPIPPMLGFLETRTYEGGRWTEKRRIKLGRGPNVIKMLYDFDLVVDHDDSLFGLWDSYYLSLGRNLWSVRETKKLRNKAGGPFRVRGRKARPDKQAGWTRQLERAERKTLFPDGSERLLLFGDTHTHSWSSDGADPADYYYHFARDYAGLDYFALSDHDFIISSTPGAEAYIAFLPKAFSEKDFICFQAYEFTSTVSGHRVAVFEGDDKPTFPLGMFNSLRGHRNNTAAQLNSFMRRFGVAPDSRVLVTAHNMLQLGNDFRSRDPAIEPLYDVTSLHIAAEKSYDEYVALGEIEDDSPVGPFMNLANLANPEASGQTLENGWLWSWQQCLGRGIGLGAFGASDTHSSNGIGSVISGVYAREKSRAAIFDALFEKRTIALDGMLRIIDIWDTNPAREGRSFEMPSPRAEVRLSAGGAIMGQSVSPSSAPTLKVEARSFDESDPVRRLSIVRDGAEVFVAGDIGVTEAERTWTDPDWTGRERYYYARMTLESGARVFSSPLFMGA